MSLKFQTDELTFAESTFLNWQFGYQDEDDPFYISLWQIINRAWVRDNSSSNASSAQPTHLARLASPGAYPEEVSIFLKFKGESGENFWLDLLERAGLEDRRQNNLAPSVERRKRSPNKRSVANAT